VKGITLDDTPKIHWDDTMRRLLLIVSLQEMEKGAFADGSGFKTSQWTSITDDFNEKSQLVFILFSEAFSLSLSPLSLLVTHFPCLIISLSVIRY
jgi:hypothetical protein